MTHVYVIVVKSKAGGPEHELSTKCRDKAEAKRLAASARERTTEFSYRVKAKSI
jgi:hypothetical protein